MELYKKQKSSGFKVSIDGHGADECFGGYLSNISYFAIESHNQLFNIYKTILNISDQETFGKIVNKFKFVNHISSFDNKKDKRQF